MASKIFVSNDGLSKSQLKTVMIFHLTNFNRTNATVDENTIHRDILSENDGMTPATSSKNLYKGLVRFTVVKNGHQDKTWPNKWMEMSVTDLADKIF